MVAPVQEPRAIKVGPRRPSQPAPNAARAAANHKSGRLAMFAQRQQADIHTAHEGSRVEDQFVDPPDRDEQHGDCPYHFDNNATGICHHLQHLRTREVAALYQPVGALTADRELSTTDGMLAAILPALDRVIREASAHFMTDSGGIISYQSCRALVDFGPTNRMTKGESRPFASMLAPQAVKKYSGYAKHFFLFTARTACPDTPPHFHPAEESTVPMPDDVASFAAYPEK